MVRGNTAIIIGERYIMFGAAGVYIIIFSPPVTSKCNKGLDTEDHELIARQILEKQGIVVGPNADDNYWKGKQKLIEEYLKQKHNIKGLSYLSLGGLKKVISSFNADPLHFCLKCFNGQEELQAPPQISSDWIDIA